MVGTELSKSSAKVERVFHQLAAKTNTANEGHGNMAVYAAVDVPRMMGNGRCLGGGSGGGRRDSAPLVTAPQRLLGAKTYLGTHSPIEMRHRADSQLWKETSNRIHLPADAPLPRDCSAQTHLIVCSVPSWSFHLPSNILNTTRRQTDSNSTPSHPSSRNVVVHRYCTFEIVDCS